MDKEAALLARIEAAKQSTRTQLNLSALRVTEERLSRELAVGLTHLTTLNLSGNEGLKSLPSSIGRLTNLTDLALDGTSLESLPRELFQLTKLTDLHLGQTKLKSLSPEIAQLTELSHLIFYGAPLENLPRELFQLTKLIGLNLGKTKLKSLPSEIGKLTELKTLYLFDTPLESLPRELFQLTKLTLLNLHGAQVKTLSSEIGQLTELRNLDLQRMVNLKALPSSICLLVRLASLDLSGCPLLTLIGGGQGTRMESSSEVNSFLKLYRIQWQKEQDEAPLYAFLESIELSEYFNLFVKEQITMTELPDLTDEDLKALGLPFRPRKTLLTKLSSLQKPSIASTHVQSTNSANSSFSSSSSSSSTRYGSDGHLLQERTAEGKDIILGDGLTSRVYLMRDTKRGNVHVAVKVMNSAVHVGDLLKEATELKKFDHPNIVKFFEAQYWDEKDTFFLVLEYCDQGSLDKYMNRIGPNKLGKLRSSLMGQIIRGLAYLHEQELAHRDIKPQNLLVHGLDEPIVKLSDFGTLKQISHVTFNTTVGTKSYVAPEVMTDEPYYSLSCDIFSLGLVFLDLFNFSYVTFYNALPFRSISLYYGSNMFYTFEEHLQSEGLNEEEASAYAKMLLLMLSPDPSDRPSLKEIALLLVPNPH